MRTLTPEEQESWPARHHGLEPCLPHGWPSTSHSGEYGFFLQPWTTVGSADTACGPNPTHPRFKHTKSNWNPAMPTWLHLPQRLSWGGASETGQSTKPNIFTIWSFAEKVCWPWVHKNQVEIMDEEKAYLASRTMDESRWRLQDNCFNTHSLGQINATT